MDLGPSMAHYPLAAGSDVANKNVLEHLIAFKTFGLGSH